MPDEQAKAQRKRPGGALDNLLRKTINLREASDPSWLPGYGESRLTHGPTYALPKDQLEQFMNATNHPESDGLTITPRDYDNAPMRRLDMRVQAAVPDLMGGSPYVQQLLQHVINNPQGQPMAFYPAGDRSTAQHEIAHQATLNLPEYKVDIPDRAADFLKARKYAPDEYANEYPAFLAGDPTEIGLTPERGREELHKFIEQIVKPRDPALAERWKRQAGLTAPSTTEADRSYSNPNVTF